MGSGNCISRQPALSEFTGNVFEITASREYLQDASPPTLTRLRYLPGSSKSDAWRTLDGTSRRQCRRRCDVRAGAGAHPTALRDGAGHPAIGNSMRPRDRAFGRSKRYRFCRSCKDIYRSSGMRRYQRARSLWPSARCCTTGLPYGLRRRRPAQDR